MGVFRAFWDRINPPLSANTRAITPFNVFGDTDLGITTASGARVSEESAFKYSVAYSAMTLIADGISGLQPQAMRLLEDGTEEAAQLPKWIHRPHPELRRADIFNQLLLSVLAWGNGYARLVRRPTDNQILFLEVLDPATVTVEWDPNAKYRRRYRISHTGPWLSSYEIFHLQGPTLPGQAAGLSVIGQAREAIGLGLTLEEFGARYFGQGSVAKTVIEMPARTLDTVEAARIVKTYEHFHKGRVNWHRPAILSGGAKLHNISINPEDAQFLESREFQATDVARWFRVPPHRVGIIGKQSSWGSGLAEENLAMLQHTYRPWILRLEEALSWYTPTDAVHIHLNTEDLLHGTFKEQAEVWTDLYEKQLATKNEARQKLGLAKVEGGDEFFEPPPTGFGASSTSSDAGVDKEKDRKRKQDEAKQ